MNSSPELGKLAAALCKAQAELDIAPKDSDNPYFNSKYADLATVWKTAQKVLPKYDLAVVQVMGETSGETVTVETILLHSSGQWVSGTLTMVPKKSDPQSIGSCITYARRYSLSAILGIVSEEDDDGNMASDRKVVDIKNTGRKKPASKSVVPGETEITIPEGRKSNTVRAREIWAGFQELGKEKNEILDLFSKTLDKTVTPATMKSLTTDEVEKLDTLLEQYRLAKTVGGEVLLTKESA